jgi:hypothetical protein
VGLPSFLFSSSWVCVPGFIAGCWLVGREVAKVQKSSDTTQAYARVVRAALVLKVQVDVANAAVGEAARKYEQRCGDCRLPVVLSYLRHLSTFPATLRRSTSKRKPTLLTRRMKSNEHKQS